MRYADITSGRVDVARLAETRDGWLGLQSEPDPRGAYPAERTARLVPCPAVREDFAPGPGR